MKNIRYFFVAFFLGLFLLPANAHNKNSKSKLPAFSAKSYIIADETGHIVIEKESHAVRPIASITKLMISILATEQDLEEKLAIPKKRNLSTSIPRNVEFLTRKELLTLSLVKSDNLASQVLCDNLDMCIEKMNSKAQEIGMINTYFDEPTGLSSKNVSTAQDLLKLMIFASTNSMIGELSSMPVAEISTGKNTIKVRNTNPLTSKFEILLSKTGFTSPAGGCLVMIMESSVGKRILILLGSNNTRSRITDMERLVKDL